MPEILTKHPDIVIKVLKSEGALCGTGATPKILTKCPSDKFCTLHGGELCVYGSNELGQMTQLAPTDVCKSSSAPAPRTGAVSPPTSEPTDVLIGAAPIAIAILAVGLVGLGQRAAVQRLRRYRRG